MHRLLIAILTCALVGLASPVFGEIDLGKFLSVGDVMQCGNIKIFKTPDGKMEMTGVSKDDKGRVILPIEVRNDIIFLDGKPCVLHSKCERSC
jgi:hypothetical protein